MQMEAVCVIFEEKAPILSGGEEEYLLRDERLLYRTPSGRQREFYIDNRPVRIHFIIVMIRWAGPALWEFEFPSPGSLRSTFLDCLSSKFLMSDAEFAMY